METQGPGISVKSSQNLLVFLRFLALVFSSSQDCWAHTHHRYEDAPLSSLPERICSPAAGSETNRLTSCQSRQGLPQPQRAALSHALPGVSFAHTSDRTRKEHKGPGPRQGILMGKRFLSGWPRLCQTCNRFPLLCPSCFLNLPSAEADLY